MYNVTAKTHVVLTPSGKWEVRKQATDETLHRFGNSEHDRLLAVAISYSLNGWRIPKWLEPYYEKVKDKIKDEEF